LTRQKAKVSLGPVRVYRAMIEGPDGLPLATPTARGLGVREWELEVDEYGLVYPEGGGLSVAPDDIQNLVRHRRPPTHGGTGLDPVWELDLGELPEALSYRQTSDKHGLLEPSECMYLSEYEEAIVETRGTWTLC
jgi:hypothetical protein